MTVDRYTSRLNSSVNIRLVLLVIRAPRSLRSLSEVSTQPGQGHSEAGGQVHGSVSWRGRGASLTADPLRRLDHAVDYVAAMPARNGQRYHAAGW
jgi:hypothetical protein